jgi:hypothetical protein
MILSNQIPLARGRFSGTPPAVLSASTKVETVHD